MILESLNGLLSQVAPMIVWGNSGGDRAIFHATIEEIIVNAKDALVWRWANSSSLGNCVRFA